MSRFRKNRPASRHRQAARFSHHRRRRRSPRLLPQLHGRGMRRLGPHRLQRLQQGGAGLGHQPLPPRRRLRIRHAHQDRPGAPVPRPHILAAATRNLINMVGGPYYPFRFGRKDGFVSKAEAVEGNLARANMSLSQIINFFAARKLNIKEMVALTGAHTIGFSHCKEFSNRLFNFSKTSDYDPKYAEGLRRLCANHTNEPQMSAYNDVITPGKFDNMYFKNLQQGLGLLASDQAMAVDKRTRPLIDLYAANQWFRDFVHAIQKVSVHNVKSQDGQEGRGPTQM